MQEIKLSTRMMILLSNSMNWPINQRSKIKRKFITYLGANTKKELNAILKELEFETYTIRNAQRLKTCKYEAKIYGLAWDDALSLAPSLGTDFLNVQMIDHSKTKAAQHHKTSEEEGDRWAFTAYDNYMTDYTA